jgi:hypothetical protein
MATGIFPSEHRSAGTDRFKENPDKTGPRGGRVAISILQPQSSENFSMGSPKVQKGESAHDVCMKIDFETERAASQELPVTVGILSSFKSIFDTRSGGVLGDLSECRWRERGR